MSFPLRSRAPAARPLGRSEHAPPDDARALRAVVEGTARPSAVKQVARICYRLAYAALKHRRANRALVGLSYEDWALDCIAELFAQTADGSFPVFERYAAQSEALPSSAADVPPWLRPLVSGAVTDRVFETYGAADPSLARTIRSVKRCARTTEALTLVRRHGTLHVACADAAADDAHGPVMPRERLEARLARVARTGAQTPTLVQAAADLLRTHPAHPPWVPVTALAQAIRAAHVHVQAGASTNVAPGAGPALMRAEAAALIQDVAAAVASEKRRTYVASGKVSAAWYEAYVQGAIRYLEGSYVHPHAAPTQHDALRAAAADACDMPLTRTAYRSDHRAVFEYMVRCIRERFIDRLQAAYGERADS